MGFNTTVVVMNDALSDIESDPEFGKKLVAAILRVGAFKGTKGFRYSDGDVSARNHVNAATVIEVHHADQDVYIRVGQNMGEVLKKDYIKSKLVLTEKDGRTWNEQPKKKGA